MLSNEDIVLLAIIGNKTAVEQLVKNNQGIIVKLAHKYNGINKELEFEDLVQAGNVGLLSSLKSYDPFKENAASFITYAFHFINRAMLNEVNGRGPKQVENNKLYKSSARLNALVGENENTEFIEMVDGDFKDIEDIEDKIYFEQLRKELEMVMDEHITLRKQDILKLRYGWDTKPMTLDEIAEILNVTRERIRQIEFMALYELRNSKWGKTTGKEIYQRYSNSKAYNYDYRYVENKIDFDIKCKDNEKFYDLLENSDMEV